MQAGVKTVTKSPIRLILLASLVAAQPTNAADHPLDPLSYQEVWRVLELVRSAGHMDRETRFSQLTLHEPPKQAVLAWHPGAAMPRKAYAVVRQGKDAFEAIVDLAADRVVILVAAEWRPAELVRR